MLDPGPLPASARPCPPHAKVQPLGTAGPPAVRAPVPLAARGLYAPTDTARVLPARGRLFPAPRPFRSETAPLRNGVLHRASMPCFVLATRAGDGTRPLRLHPCRPPGPSAGRRGRSRPAVLHTPGVFAPAARQIAPVLGLPDSGAAVGAVPSFVLASCCRPGAPRRTDVGLAPPLPGSVNIRTLNAWSGPPHPALPGRRPRSPRGRRRPPLLTTRGRMYTTARPPLPAPAAFCQPTVSFPAPAMRSRLFFRHPGGEGGQPISPPLTGPCRGGALVYARSSLRPEPPP